MLNAWRYESLSKPRNRIPIERDVHWNLHIVQLLASPQTNLFVEEEMSFIAMKASVAARVRVSMSELSSRSGVIYVPRYRNESQKEMKLLLSPTP